MLKAAQPVAGKMWTKQAASGQPPRAAGCGRWVLAVVLVCLLPPGSPLFLPFSEPGSPGGLSGSVRTSLPGSARVSFSC